MLEKFASSSRPLFGLSGFWLNETHRINKTNQINEITRQTGLVLDLRTERMITAQTPDSSDSS